MRPKQQKRADHDDLFKARLDQIINMRHELVILADKIDRPWLDFQIAPYFSDQGRPGEPVRFMIGMFILKHTYALSDEGIWERWVNDPYFQYFTGEEFFQHQLPHERSGMTHWRNRIGETLDNHATRSSLRRAAPRPSRPRPNRVRVADSGTRAEI